MREEDLEKGSIYPPLSRIREVSAAIAEQVAEIAFREGLAGIERPADPGARIRELMYEPEYPDFA